MASSSSSTVSDEQFKLFHSIDREVYRLLVINLWRDPVESMQIMALWLWLERMGYPIMVKKILALPYILINEVADESNICISCVNDNQFASQNSDIPLMQILMEKEISLKYFHDNRLCATQGMAKFMNDVCIRALYDIMQQAIERNCAQISFLTTTQKIPPSSTQPRLPQTESNDVPPEDRTMFVTFSKGYPVHKWEVKEFFTRTYGDCIESLHMQEVEFNEQALFARIVFYSAATIDVILNGVDKVKFNINGKHVWARKFVPKRAKSSLLSPLLSNSSPPS